MTISPKRGSALALEVGCTRLKPRWQYLHFLSPNNVGSIINLSAKIPMLLSLLSVISFLISFLVVALIKQRFSPGQN
ncbi:MAG: hypothetical protein EWV80_01965 [Microcystis aeruginosa Ma_QC_B_20070730_S2]|uniref:Uncharacterized protein n=1 Tax=Microcystis aeruginosa Ma_QC_B_20070730_S2 TaxID=2486256 RepID=A0A552E7P1_MICAE|nr:MAG: hypothetical protein EWV80_01965 [Microcystis aeruginosa Ma_QC_B_20070730_S2]